MGRAILDEAFRNELFVNPENAIKEAGLSLSDEEMAQIKANIAQVGANLTPEQINLRFDGAVVQGRW